MLYKFGFSQVRNHEFGRKSTSRSAVQYESYKILLYIGLMICNKSKLFLLYSGELLCLRNYSLCKLVTQQDVDKIADYYMYTFFYCMLYLTIPWAFLLCVIYAFTLSGVITTVVFPYILSVCISSLFPFFTCFINFIQFRLALLLKFSSLARKISVEEISMYFSLS